MGGGNTKNFKIGKNLKLKKWGGGYKKFQNWEKFEIEKIFNF